MSRTLADLLDRLPDRSRPFVTYYDVATAERVELSATTCANWVAKVSNFLVDEADAVPGTRVRLGLPTHWLRTVWLLAAWQVGAVVTDHTADLGISGPDLTGDEPVRAASALLPFGARFPQPPEGFLDLGAEIPGHGDVFVALDPPGPDDLALDLPGHRHTHAQLLAAATPDRRRLLVGPGPVSEDARLVVATATGGGSLVLVTGGDEEQIARIADQEQALPMTP